MQNALSVAVAELNVRFLPHKSKDLGGILVKDDPRGVIRARAGPHTDDVQIATCHLYGVTPV